MAGIVDIAGVEAAADQGPAVPGGANTNVQFNDSGAFGGSSAFTFNKTTGVVTVVPVVTTGLNNTGALFINANGSAAPGSVHADGIYVVANDSENIGFFGDTFANNVSFIGRRANGTNASKSVVVANDLLALFGGRGYANAGGLNGYLSTGNGIGIYAAETFSTTAGGGYITMATAALTTTAKVEGTRFQPSGGVSIGNSTFNATDPGNGVLNALNNIQINTHSVPYVFAASAVESAVHTGDTILTTFYTIAIPANTLGANGRLRITLSWRFTGTAGAKTMQVGFGGTTFFTAASGAATLTAANQIVIANRNSTSSQVLGNVATTTSFGDTTTDIVTGSVDTTASQDLVIQGQLANSGDSIAVESYLIEVIRP